MHTILFVDDEPSILSSLSYLFKRTYNVLTAQNGPDALKLFRTTHTPIHVIVSDQRMPDMLGVELLREVKTISPSTMRILLTGYSDLQSVIASVNTGEVFRYINKPWNNDKLRDTIVQACQFSDRIQQLRENVQFNKAVTGLDSEKPEMHVLFIEPDAINRNALSALFQNDYTVHLAGTASEAFTLLQHHPIAVITTEANLGDVDGADFLAAVKNMYPSITTILLTDIQDSVLAIRLINEGSVFRYLVKPFRRDTLRTTLSEAILEHKSAKEKPGTSIKMLESESEPAMNLDSENMSNILKNVREIIQHRSSY